MKHAEAHPMAGKTVEVIAGTFKGQKYRVEDYWDRVSGKSWMVSDGNPACLDWALRSVDEDCVAFDDEVLYGKIGMFGKLIHVSQISVESVE